MRRKDTNIDKMNIGAFERGSVEKKIEEHIRSIQSLIQQIEQKEMQCLFTGLLASVLTNPATGQELNTENLFFEQPAAPDNTVLSDNELNLIGELSEKIEELYRLKDSNH
ncbi:MAG: hypothetical protein HKO56_04870 [Bacteroidia bacterium]|nr:hypothetical protein [Bacteroidia bacterium]NNC84500.1 hypothetical protein [Bacteroidia bacterium]NNM15970.1 hypothetical protein [Bacteroidia bacterium]